MAGHSLDAGRLEKLRSELKKEKKDLIIEKHVQTSLQLEMLSKESKAKLALLEDRNALLLRQRDLFAPWYYWWFARFTRWMLTNFFFRRDKNTES